MQWGETDFTFSEDSIEVTVRHIPAWVCKHGDDASFPPSAADEIIETVRELITVAKKTRLYRPSSFDQEYLVRVVA